MAATSPQATKGPVIQQRVFIGNMQRFNMVEITASTNAGDVLDLIEAQGGLKGWVGSGGWMVWEVAQDFGMGRLKDILLATASYPYIFRTSDSELWAVGRCASFMEQGQDVEYVYYQADILGTHPESFGECHENTPAANNLNMDLGDPVGFTDLFRLCWMGGQTWQVEQALATASRAWPMALQAG
jgi:hypothetical protein